MDYPFWEISPIFVSLIRKESDITRTHVSALTKLVSSIIAEQKNYAFWCTFHCCTLHERQSILEKWQIANRVHYSSASVVLSQGENFIYDHIKVEFKLCNDTKFKPANGHICTINNIQTLKLGYHFAI